MEKRTCLKGLAFLALLALAGCGAGGTGTSAKANAGDDIDALIGQAVTLDGTGSSNVTNASWSFVSVPTGSSSTLSSAGTLKPSFTPDVAGAYQVRLSINNGASTDDVTVTAKSGLAAITVDSSSAVTTRTRFNTKEYVIDLGQTGGTLSATTSQGSIASYKWEQISGPSATASGGNTGSTLTFTAPTLGNLMTDSDHYKWQPFPISRDNVKMTFKLTVADASGNSDAATFVVNLQDGGAEIHPSSGLPNVGLGTTVRLSGPDLKANSASASTAITDWSWSLSVPSGSKTTFVNTGTTSSSIEFPQFVPDVAGIYTVSYSSTSAGSSGTPLTGKILVNAAKYAGVGTVGGTTAVEPQCGNCHDGTISGLDDMLTPWSKTKHAKIFENNVSTYAGEAPASSLWEIHTVGFDGSSLDEGFSNLLTTTAFEFPSTGLSFSDFVTQEPRLSKLANVQCESCHGPGDQHAGDPLRIAVSASQFGICGQCHIEEAQWINSAHQMTGIVHGRGVYQSVWATNAGCTRCHTAKGFANYLDGGEDALTAITETGAFPGLTCAGCHDPHDATNEHQLRVTGNVTMVVDGSTVNAGKAAVCYTCHDALYSYKEKDCDSDSNGLADAKCTTLDQTATQYWRQVHYNPQAPILEGKGALTDLNGDGTADFTLSENSFHSGTSFIRSEVTGDNTLSTTNDKCITCHMATGPTVEQEGYLHLGGHSFKLRTGHSIGHLKGEEIEKQEAAEAGTLQLTSACTVCHPSVTDLNRLARADYDGDGTIEGIQDEVKGLLLALSNKIKGLDTANISQTSGTTSSGGTITPDAIAYAGAKSSFPTGKNCTTSLPTDGKDAYQPCNFIDASATLRRGIWNHNLIVRDGSLGVHNAAYTIQVLQKTYSAVGGNSFATDFPKATLR